MLRLPLQLPRPPLVLGLVLARLTENYLFLSVSRYDFDWLTRPIVMVLGALCLTATFFPLIQPMLSRAIARRTPLNKPVEVFQRDES